MSCQMKPKGILVFLMMLVFFISAEGKTRPPEPATKMMQEANDTYNRGHYQEAVAAYQKLVDMGLESAVLYYNLGNACFKAGDIPSAILYYERSLLLEPADEDAAFNLKVAYSRTVDKIEEVPLVFYKRWWQQLAATFSRDIWATISLVGFALFFAMLLLFLLARQIWIRKMAFWSALVVMVISIHAVAFAYRAQHKLLHGKEAIIFNPSVTVKSSPDEESVDLFVIHEGTKVAVIDELGEWKEIRIASGSEGWIKATDIVKI